MVALTVCAGVACGEAPSYPQPLDWDVVWRVPGEGLSITPAVDGDVVYFGGLDHELAAIERSTGRVLWRGRTGGGGGMTGGQNVVVAGGHVIMGDQDLNSFLPSGTPGWIFRPDNDDQPGFGFLATDGATIYAGTPEGQVYAVNASTGTQRWMTRPLDELGTSIFSPALHADTLYVCLKRFEIPSTGGLAALDAQTGRVLWLRRFTPEIPGQYSGCVINPVFAEDLVIASAEDGRVHAFQRSSGTSRWTVPRVLLPPPQGSLADYRQLATAGSIVFVGSSDGRLTLAVDGSSGRERWRSSGSLSSVSWHAVSDGESFYVNHTLELVVYDARTGDVRWKSSVRDGRATGPDGQFYASPTFADGMIFVSGTQGYYAIRAR